MQKRPSDLPDFKKPPLNEVLIGVQFATPPNYQQVMSGEVWALFKDEFPIVQELPPLSPIFETFGQPAGAQVNFGFVTGPQHDRFWFVSNEGDQLIQFQNDRLLHNWRKLQGVENEYPRFEQIIEKFENEASKLSTYFERIDGKPLLINQCEIAYINHLVPTTPGRINLGDWLSIVRFGASTPDDFSLSFRRRIDDQAGKPMGRLLIDSSTAAKPDGTEFISLAITARAMPREPNLKSALEFFHMGREMIVRSFTEMTTDSAHKIWERIH